MEEISQSMPDSSDDLTLLKQYHQEWVVYRDQCKYLPGPFRSLEEELLNDSETGEETSIYQILLLEWGNILEKYEKRLCKAALELVKQERDGQIQDNQEFVISLKESFSDLSEGTFFRESFSSVRFVARNQVTIYFRVVTYCFSYR